MAQTKGGATPLSPTLLEFNADIPAIRVGDLNHYYGAGEFRKQALFDVQLRVMPGEIAIMTGPSGCGKTTLLTLIGALRKAQQGTIDVLGKDLMSLGQRDFVDLRRNIGFIFQAHNLFGSLTALENVRMAVELEQISGKEASARATAMLEHLGLSERIGYKPGRLSGGQRQRVAIARALVNRPKLVLADEPTAALDEESGHVVMNLLRRYAKEHGTAIVVVTHDQRVLDAADRIVSMSFGRIVSNVLKEERTLICEFLTRVESFKNLSPSTIAEIADQLKLERYAAGSVLFRQGDIGDRFYVIRRGSAEVLIGQADDTIARRFLEEGDSFGEIALLKDVPRTASVVALTELDVYSLDKAAFKKAVDRSETFKEQLWKIYFQRQ